MAPSLLCLTPRDIIVHKDPTYRPSKSFFESILLEPNEHDRRSGTGQGLAEMDE